jgi:hypothetical protein
VLGLVMGGGALALVLVIQDLTARSHPEGTTPMHSNTQVRIETKPTGATYAWTAAEKGRGSIEGLTPATREIPNGDWTLRLESPWHVPWDSSLTLRGDSLDLSVSLASFGSARITSDPVGAGVRYRRDASSGWRVHPVATPATIDSLEPGEWTIRLSRRDYEPLSATIMVPERQLTELLYTLVPADTTSPAPPPQLPQPASTDSVRYCVSVSPGAARVHLDGELYPGFEQDGFVFLTLSVGDHLFRVQSGMAPTVELVYEVQSGELNRSLVLDFEARRIIATTGPGLCEAFDP